MIYAFGEFRLDLTERRLTRAGQPVAVPPKVLDTLAVLVEAEGRLVRRADLMRRLWPDSFVEDATLGRNISDLRRILGAGLIETVPRTGYRFAAEVAIVPAPAPAQRRWVPLAAAALGVVLLVFAGWRLWRPAEAEVRSMAILPFLSLDGSPENSVMGQQIADSLITRLSAFRLVVRPTSAVLPYGTPSRDPLEAGRRLRVDAVLDGTVQAQGGSRRVTMRLLRVRDGRSLWSATFDEPTADIFVLEDAVSARLERFFAPAAGRVVNGAGTHGGSQAARLRYYEGRYWFEKRTEPGFRRAIECYRQATATDPQYARAFSSLAEAYLLLSGYGFASQDVYVPLARQAAQRALALDPTLGEAHNALALIAEDYDLDWARAEAEYRQALVLSPNYATAHHFYGEFLSYLGRADESRAQLDQAAELDPTSLIIMTDTAQSLIMARHYRESAELLAEILRRDPAFARARYWRTLALALGDDCGAARQEAAALTRLQTGPTTTLARGVLEARCGDRRAALRVASRPAEFGPWSAIGSGLVYAALGHGDQAFYWLNRAVDSREIGVVALPSNPLLDPVRRDPRFQTLLARARFRTN